MSKFSFRHASWTSRLFSWTSSSLSFSFLISHVMGNFAERRNMMLSKKKVNWDDKSLLMSVASLENSTLLWDVNQALQVHFLVTSDQAGSIDNVTTTDDEKLKIINHQQWLNRPILHSSDNCYLNWFSLTFPIQPDWLSFTQFIHNCISSTTTSLFG